MKSKLVIIILILLIQAVFAGLNIKNVSDISFGFAVLKDVPVFLTVTLSFIAGAIIILPIALFSAKKSRKTAEIKKENKEKKKGKKFKIFKNKNEDKPEDILQN
jgi:uncharacterized integral membrane protein